VLEHAGIQNARLLVIASPDSYSARRVLDIARKHNAGIDAVVRTHTEHELEHFEKAGVGHVMMAERELARGMATYSVTEMKKGGLSAPLS
jgi:monovalent cation:H+ antiporter-2, CPA2 family